MMWKIYFNRLLIGTITYDAIPDKIDKKTGKTYKELVKNEGIEWVKSGRLSVEEFEMLFKEEYSEE